MEISLEQGLTVQEGVLSQDALRRSDEVFITSTAGGIMPVTRLDGHPVKDGKVGPITETIKTIYWHWHEDARFVDEVSYPI